MNCFIETISSDLITKKNLRFSFLRTDLIPGHLSGNKYFKLKYNLAYAKEKGYSQLLTFGGAFSNHLYAVAAAGKDFQFQTIGLVRGEELRDKTRNPTLSFCEKKGMELHFVDRSTYRKKDQPDYLKKLQTQFPKAYIIPEGGSNDLAVKGTSEILNKQSHSYTHICCSAGTGGTVAGIIQSSQKDQKVLVFPALKDSDFLHSMIQRYTDKKNYSLINDYHHGGFAKYSDNLLTFVNDFKSQHGIPLEPIYTGKMVFGLMDLIKKDYFPQGSCLLVIHTGGLQSIEGINQKQKLKNKDLLLL